MPRVFFAFLCILSCPFLPVLSFLERGCLMPLCLSEVDKGRQLWWFFFLSSPLAFLFVLFQGLQPCKRFKPCFFPLFQVVQPFLSRKNGAIGRASPPVLSAHSPRLSKWLLFSFTPFKVCTCLETRHPLYPGNFTTT